LLIPVLLVCGVLLDGSVVRGVVRDAQSGEPLAHVSVKVVGQAREVLTDGAGRFDVGELAAGQYSLKIATVGYRLAQIAIQVKTGETMDYDVVLSPDTFHRTDRVEVHADAFDTRRSGGPTEFSLRGNEVKNLSSVLADDPMRSVHSLPGVSSNDDFEGRFSVHAAPYERVGLYLDGLLLHQPLHTVQGEGPSGSLAVFNGDMIESVELQSGAWQARFGDRTAGVLDVRTREGSRTQTNFRVMASAPSAGVMAEGPLGSEHQGSWLASVRKSYLQYLLQQTADGQPTMAFGFTDAQAHLTYSVGAKQTLKVNVLDGQSDFDRSHAQSQLATNAAMSSGYHYTLASLGWEFAPTPEFVVTSHAAFMRERYDNSNRYDRALGEGFYGEFVWSTNAIRNWGRAGTTEFGSSVRRVRGDGFADYYFDAVHQTRVEEHRGGAVLSSGYVQQTWGRSGGWIFLSAGFRWDHASSTAKAALSPQASITAVPWKSARVQLAWGEASQFPDVQDRFSRYAGANLLPARAVHYLASFEQRLGKLSRVRVQAWQRNDRDLLFRPALEARMAGGAIQGDNFQAPIRNSLRGYARGLEFVVQRRTANRITGWASYNLGYARMYDGASGIRFAPDQDQRHTVNAYLGYRIRPSVHLSTKWSYGSGFPVPGFFRKDGDNQYYLAAQRNGARLGPYQRTDVRVNKSRTFERWKMTIYGEVVNVMNRSNYRFDSYDGYDATGRAYLSLSKMFPVLPSAGIMIEF
jgi:hypothetical protein